MSYVIKLRNIALLFIVLCASNLSIAQTVHYTKTGKKYHSQHCQYLRKSDYTCDLQSALNMGLTPCSRCAPPTQVTSKRTQTTVKPYNKKQPKKQHKKRLSLLILPWQPESYPVAKLVG